MPNLATKYSSKLDQLWTHASYTDAWINKKYDFDGVATVKVYTATSVDPNEQGMRAKKAGEVMRIEMNEKIIPMIDMDRLATAAAGATAVSQAITMGTDFYQDVLKANEYLDECKAPLEGRVLFVTPAAYTKIKTAITTTVLATEYNNKLVGKGFVGELDGVPVVKVPTSYFPTGVMAIVVHRDALLGARQITETRIIENSELVSGSVLVGRFIFGSFILAAKNHGVASIVDGSAVSS